MNAILIDANAGNVELLDDLDTQLEFARALTGGLIEQMSHQDHGAHTAGQLNAIYSELVMAQRLLEKLDRRSIPS